MAPPTNSNGDDADMRFLVNMLAHCGELNLDSKGLAKAAGISQSYNVYPKIRKILSSYGFTYDSNSKHVVKVEAGNDEGSNICEIQKRFPKSKNATATPGLKNRHKITEIGKEEQMAEVVLGGPVMKMETTPGLGEWNDDETEEEPDIP